MPPIETTGLTNADVADLAIKTREMMVQALREISVPYEPSGAKSDKLERDSTLMPPPPLPQSKSIGITEIRPAGGDPISVEPDSDSTRQRTPSLVRSVASSESQETEEEDGHVLVRKPGA